MCGICGVYNAQSGEPVSEQLIEHMTHLISHRGPDDSGAYLDGPVGLGFARLSIIDLDGGHQPMSNETGDIWIVFNGEIWNYQVLRKELTEKGHQFRTNCLASPFGIALAGACCWHETARARSPSITPVSMAISYLLLRLSRYCATLASRGRLIFRHWAIFSVYAMSPGRQPSLPTSIKCSLVTGCSVRMIPSTRNVIGISPSAKLSTAHLRNISRAFGSMFTALSRNV